MGDGEHLRQVGRGVKLRDPGMGCLNTGKSLSEEVLVGREVVGRHADALDELLADTGAPASARLGAVEVWLRHHPGVDPWVVAVRSDGDIVAAALFTRTLRTGVYRLGKAGQRGEPSCLPARDAVSARALARAVRRGLGALDRRWFLQLSDLPDPDRVVTALRLELDLSAVGPGDVAPQLCFTPGRPLNAYLSRNTRSAVAKARNRMDGAGLHRELTWIRNAVEVECSLPDIVDVHRRRNHQLRGWSAFDDSGQLGLFVDTVRAHAYAGRVHLLTLRLDGALAAFALCLEAPGVLWVYANMVSPDWIKFSAGTITNAEVVRAAHANETINCVDWGAGVQRYKMSGEVTLSPRQSLQAWSSRTTWLGWTGLQVGRRALVVTATEGRSQTICYARGVPVGPRLSG